MKIVLFGAGVQGTLYGVRLARACHDVTFIARLFTASPESTCRIGARVR
jgi:ketopantoate reductase